MHQLPCRPAVHPSRSRVNAVIQLCHCFRRSVPAGPCTSRVHYHVSQSSLSRVLTHLVLNNLAHEVPQLPGGRLASVRLQGGHGVPHHSARLRYLILDAVARRIFEDCLLSGHVRFRSMNTRYRRGGRSARCVGRTLWTWRNCPAQSSATCKEERQAQTELKLEHNSQHRTQIDSKVRAVLHHGISAW